MNYTIAPSILIPISSPEVNPHKSTLMFCCYKGEQEQVLSVVEDMLQQNGESVHKKLFSFEFTSRENESGSEMSETISWVDANLDQFPLDLSNFFGITKEFDQGPFLFFYNYFPKTVFKYLYRGPFEIEPVLNWLDRIKDGKEKVFYKNEEKSQNDQIEGWKGLKQLVNSSYDDLVWNSSKDVLVVNYVTDCEPCDDLFPVIDFVGQLLEEGGENVSILCMNIEKNDMIDEFNESFIPVLRLVRGEQQLKRQLLPCSEEVLTEELLRFLHSNCTNTFYLEKYEDKCKEFDKFYSLKLRAKKIINSSNEIVLSLQGKGTESCIQFVNSMSQCIESKINERSATEAALMIDELIESSELKTLRKELEQQITGNTISIKDDKMYREIFNSKENAVLYFTATWCGPCKMIAPQVGKLSTMETRYKFYKLDNDELLEIFKECKIKSIPHFKKVVDGEFVDDLQTLNPDTLSNWILQ